jgi:hypothetical protein
MALPDYVLLIPDDWDEATPNTTIWNKFQMVTGTSTGIASYIQVIGDASNASQLRQDVSAQSYTSGFMRVHLGGSGFISSDLVICVLEGATTDLFRLVVVNTTEHWKAEYWDGATWTQVGATITAPVLSSSLTTVDIEWNIADAGGEWTVHVNGVSTLTFTGDTLTTADTTVDFVRFPAPGTGTGTYTAVAGVCIDSVSTLDLVLTEETSSGAGFHSDYDGAESSVDNFIGSGVQSNYITMTTDLDRASFPFFANGAGVTDSYTIEGVALLSMAWAISDPGFIFQGFARQSSADADGDNQVQVTASGNETFIRLNFDVDPATAVAWTTITVVQAAQFGYQAQTV